MGFRQAAVLASVSFFTGTQVPYLSRTIIDRLRGVLFICMNVDYRLLWSLDDQAVKDGFVFYTTFYHAPPAIRVRRMFSCRRQRLTLDVILPYYRRYCTR